MENGEKIKVIPNYDHNRFLREQSIIELIETKNYDMIYKISKDPMEIISAITYHRRQYRGQMEECPTINENLIERCIKIEDICKIKINQSFKEAYLNDKERKTLDHCLCDNCFNLTNFSFENDCKICKNMLESILEPNLYFCQSCINLHLNMHILKSFRDIEENKLKIYDKL